MSRFHDMIARDLERVLIRTDEHAEVLRYKLPGADLVSFVGIWTELETTEEIIENERRWLRRAEIEVAETVLADPDRNADWSRDCLPDPAWTLRGIERQPHGLLKLTLERTEPLMYHPSPARTRG